MCNRDMLFWVNAFLMIYDPRKKLKLPFITHLFQDGVFLELQASAGNYPLVLEKSRQLGVTWKALATALWFFSFSRGIVSFLLTSRLEDAVDKSDEKDTLFGRIDFMIKHLPGWLRPPNSRVHLLLTNKRSGSDITGEATTGKAGRGKVRTVVIPDEFAHVDPPKDTEMVSSVVPMTYSVWYISTPNGVGNEFHKKRHQPGMKVITLHWSEHPEYARGLYVVRDGLVEIVDQDYPFPPDYQFNFPYPNKFKVRSPWFDQKCLDLGSMRLILQELEINYHGSGSKAFDTEILQKVLQTHVVPPFKVGRLVYEPGTCRPREFVDSNMGNLKLWVYLDAKSKPARETSYIIGCDISRGTGATPSCASVVDRTTGEKVASYKTASRSPHEFAEDVVALCKWFCSETGMPAYLIWEASGPGQTFGQAVEKLHFSHVYFHRREQDVDKKPTRKAGYWPANTELFNMIIENLDRAYGKGRFINRCKEDVEAAFQYRMGKGGKFEHSGARNADDPADSGVNHGDAVVADGMAVHVLEIYRTDTTVKKQPAVKEGSFAHRRKLRKKEALRKEEDW